MAKNTTKAPLLVKKSDSKKGSLWHDFADKRFRRQHGGYDIPEGDLHAIHRFENPVLSTPATTEETNTALSNIEKEIQQLKTKDTRQLGTPSKPPQDFEEFFDNKQVLNNDDLNNKSR